MRKITELSTRGRTYLSFTPLHSTRRRSVPVLPEQGGFAQNGKTFSYFALFSRKLLIIAFLYDFPTLFTQINYQKQAKIDLSTPIAKTSDRPPPSGFDYVQKSNSGGGGGGGFVRGQRGQERTIIAPLIRIQYS